MIESMTGYGHSAIHTPDFQVVAEIKTVNHKFLELSLKLPQNYIEQEIHLRNAIANRIKRGKGFLLVQVDHLNPNKGGGKAHVNMKVLQGYYEDLQAAASLLGMEKPKIRLADLLALPNAVNDGGESVADEEWELVRQAVGQAMDKLVENRQREGTALLPEFECGIRTIRECMLAVEPFEKRRLDTLRSRLENGLAELAKNMNVSEDRFQQELFYYIEKYDISEEKARIAVHVNAFEHTLFSDENNGRKLQFLQQELWREVNTLGNKAYSINIQTLVVKMKEELEKIKEQLMNIV